MQQNDEFAADQVVGRRVVPAAELARRGKTDLAPVIADALMKTKGKGDCGRAALCV
eukprot:SAG31_NODE_3185_length_4579_cov_2.704911_3_plen_56_part_00